MLLLTTAAVTVIRTRRRDAVGRCFKNLLSAGFDEIFLFRKDLGGNDLAGKRSLDEAGFTAWKMREAFPAKRSLFYGKLYELQRTDCLKLGRAWIRPNQAIMFLSSGGMEVPKIGSAAMCGVIAMSANE